MDYYWHGGALKTKFQNVSDVKSVWIATAFLSTYGLEVIRTVVSRNAITKENVHVYLSPEFSTKKPSHLLNELRILGTVYIVYDIPFHSKVYLLEGDNRTEVIFGSSNCTKGGIEKNIEFDAIKQLEDAEKDRLKLFFEYCTNNSKAVTNEVIEAYKNSETELEELERVQHKIRSKLRIFHTSDDPFDRDTYDFDGYFFTYEDYEILFKSNQSRNDVDARNKRKATQDKLLKIHESLNPQMEELGLHCHWNKQHITSLIVPSEFNKGRVSWIGIRYGKSHDEVDLLSAGNRENEFLGFQKHACIQLSINESGLEVALFHAVAKDAVDRRFLHEKLIEQSKIESVTNEIRNLQGHGFVWTIYNAFEQQVQATFTVDSEPPENFVDFYKQEDEWGVESFLSYFVPANDPSIQTVDMICNLVIQKAKLLLPLYQEVAFRFPDGSVP